MLDIDKFYNDLLELDQDTGNSVLCELCEQAIYEGDSFYKIQNETLCEECMKDNYREIN